MATTKVMTAALAVIKVGGDIVGRMKTIRVTETFRRGDVRGLGEVASQEKPIVGWDGTLACSFYTIDLKKLGTVAASKFGINRNAGDVKKFFNTLILNEITFDVYIYKKFAQVVDTTTGLVSDVGDGDFAVVENILFESQSFDISEGSVSGSDANFSYLSPILFEETVS
jgi:hypothetical protein